MYKEILQVKTRSVYTSSCKNANVNFALPKSYVDYCKELGYGLLCELFIVYIPFEEPNLNYPDTLAVQNEYIKRTFKEYIDSNIYILKNKIYLDLIKNAEPFGVGENGEFLFWNIQEHKNEESKIYVAKFPVGIYEAGENLYEFIDRVTNEKKFKSILRFNEFPLPKVFKPYTELRH